MTNIQQIGITPCLKEQVNFKQKSNNLYQVNFKNNDKDTYTRSNKKETVRTTPPMYDREAAMQRAMEQQEKDRKSQKRKQNLSWGLGIAVSLAFVTYFGSMGIGWIRNRIKNSPKNFEKQFVSLADKKGIVSANNKSIDPGFRTWIRDIQTAEMEYPKEMYEFLGEEATPNMLLITGGSGTGKSYNADVVCKELGWKRLEKQFADVSSKYIGETSKEVERLFTSTEQVLMANPNEEYCLVMNEADPLFVSLKNLREGDDYLKQMRGALLNGLDRVRKYKNFHLIATTNASIESGMLDEAIVRRIGNNYALPYPEVDALFASLETHLHNSPFIKRGKFDFFKDNVDEIKTFLKEMHNRRAGHGDIETLAKNAKTKYRRYITDLAIEKGAIKQNGNKYEIIDKENLMKIYDENPFSVEFLQDALKMQGTLAGEMEKASESIPLADLLGKLTT